MSINIEVQRRVSDSTGVRVDFTLNINDEIVTVSLSESAFTELLGSVNGDVDAYVDGELDKLTLIKTGLKKVTL